MAAALTQATWISLPAEISDATGTQRQLLQTAVLA
jgi:hypothetical protein